MRDKLSNANLDWGDDDAPRSIFFDDIYFSGDGPAETTHVFLHGNNLPERFSSAAQFTIGELGFGTGLNFLVAWDAWLNADKPAGAKLNFFSVEKFPLTTGDLQRAHHAWSALAKLSEKLRAALPPPHPGLHQIHLDNNICLTLFWGDALDGLSGMQAKTDAWFLDGFAPSKNPAMWSPSLFAEMARLSAPGATAATFTVAGAVRRGLEGAGFALEKRPGHGRKREMLTARMEKPPQAPSETPWFDKKFQTIQSRARIGVVGAGIAGASLVHALARRGFEPILFDANGPASGASGNPAGLIMPRLDVGDTPAGRFHASAYLHAIALLEALNVADVFSSCGIVFHATTDREKERHRKLMRQGALPNGWIEPRDDGLYFPQAGVVDPQHFVRALIGNHTLHEEKVERLEREDAIWRIITIASEHEADAVVIAAGLESLRFSQMHSVPLAGSAGQIDRFPDAPPPIHAHAFGPYAAPAPGGGLVIGATYAPVGIGANPRFSKEATLSNLDAVARRMPDLVCGLTSADARPRVSVRCTTPDRLPIAGPVPDWGFFAGAYDGLRVGKRGPYPAAEYLPNLHVMTGLGSRGLVTAPLLSEMIAAQLAGAPLPVDSGVVAALHPARFFIRDQKRPSQKAP